MHRTLVLASLRAGIGAAALLLLASVPGALHALEATPPVPRPKPPSLAGKPMPAELKAESATHAAPVGGAVAGRRGRLGLSLTELGRERDPYTAADLAPNENTSWPERTVALARRRCDVVLATTNLDAEPINPIGGPGGCGIAAPVKVSSFGLVKVHPPAVLNCTMAAALYQWITDEVQPAAIKSFKQPIVRLRQISAYSCRRRRNVGATRISEHSFGNALDIAGFTLASGQWVSVLDDWSSGLGTFFGFNRPATFLTRSHKAACTTFATVLGPNADKAHKNHFHLDLGRAGRYKFCK